MGKENEGEQKGRTGIRHILYEQPDGNERLPWILPLFHWATSLSVPGSALYTSRGELHYRSFQTAATVAELRFRLQTKRGGPRKLGRSSGNKGGKSGEQTCLLWRAFFVSCSKVARKDDRVQFDSRSWSSFSLLDPDLRLRINMANVSPETARTFSSP